MAGYGTPTAPNPSPAIMTGWYADPANRGVDLATLKARTPSFGSWDQALADPSITGLPSDTARTNYLRDVYGLSGGYGVKDGRIVVTDHSTRNGLLGALAVIGGPFAAEALTGAGAGAATGATLATSSTPGGAALGIGATGAAAGATGASMSAIPGLADILLKYGVPTIGNLLGTKMQVNASSEAERLQADYNNRALAAAQEEQAYARKRAEEQTTYDRGQYGSYLSRLQPYQETGTRALSRLESALQNSLYQPNSGYQRRIG